MTPPVLASLIVNSSSFATAKRRGTAGRRGSAHAGIVARRRDGLQEGERVVTTWAAGVFSASLRRARKELAARALARRWLRWHPPLGGRAVRAVDPDRIADAVEQIRQVAMLVEHHVRPLPRPPEDGAPVVEVRLRGVRRDRADVPLPPVHRVGVAAVARAGPRIDQPPERRGTRAHVLRLSAAGLRPILVLATPGVRENVEVPALVHVERRVLPVDADHRVVRAAEHRPRGPPRRAVGSASKRMRQSLVPIYPNLGSPV